jgi:hypothetical protein
VFSIGNSNAARNEHRFYMLTNLSTTALNQNDQHDDKEHAGNYPDNRCIVHVSSPLSMREILVKRFRYHDSGRTQSHQKERGEDKEHQRKDQLDGGLCRLLLHFLAALRS